MQIVIDIPEELYEAYKGKLPMLGDGGMDMIAQAIANGTPLPKGHGRLIDANTVNKSVKDPYQNREVMYWINNAPTILKAEREEV